MQESTLSELTEVSTLACMVAAAKDAPYNQEEVGIVG